MIKSVIQMTRTILYKINIQICRVRKSNQDKKKLLSEQPTVNIGQISK